jgi:GNAT superfamily N-acetyltransferase
MTDSANLDLVRSIYADWERGDFASAEWADADIELLVLGGTPPGRFTGLAEMAEGFRSFAGAWEGYRVEVDQYRELDRDRVLVFVHDAGRGKTSGLDIGRMVGERAMLFQLSFGKVRRLTIYWERDRAFADLGLTPEGD